MSYSTMYNERVSERGEGEKYSIWRLYIAILILYYPSTFLIERKKNDNVFIEVKHKQSIVILYYMGPNTNVILTVIDSVNVIVSEKI